MNKDKLHCKNLGKYTLNRFIGNMHNVSESIAGSFYHYTSLEGMMGILKSKHLYFTDCQYLNDYKERLHINDIVSMFWSIFGMKYESSFCDLLKDIKINSYVDSDYTYYESNREVECRYFVLSTSINKDSLSMWKYYSKNNAYNGICIGLFTPALVDEWIDRETGVKIEEGKIIYDDNIKIARIKENVDVLYKNWQLYKRSDKFDRKIKRDFKSWLSYASLFFKHSCFSSEEEYRFVAIAKTQTLTELYYKDNDKVIKMYDFRIVNNVPAPFIKMPFCTYHTQDSSVISRIGIAPSSQSDLIIDGIKRFIGSLDYQLSDIEYYRSVLPLRY